MTHHLVLDVGGTTTTLGILAADKTTIIHQLSEPTQPGVLYFPEFIGDLVKRGAKIAAEKGIGVDSRVVVAMPGNFPSGSSIILKPGSARQLLIDGEEFPAADITNWFTSAFPKEFSVVAINDALAQAIGTMQQHWRDDFSNQVMLYIGPGTGLGGAILSLGDDPSDYEIITDGHIFDIIVTSHAQHIPAEDILSGRGIFERTGITAKDLNERDEYWNRHQAVVDDCADCITQLIHHIQHQTVTKVAAHQAWSAADMAQASSFGVVVLGGSIGTQGRLGQRLLASVQQSFNGPVIQSPDPVTAALMGAVSII